MNVTLGPLLRIVYKRGSDNKVVDALSRHTAPPMELAALSTCSPTWVQKIQEGYQGGSKAQELLTALVVSPDAILHYTLKDGLLHYKNRIWLGTNEQLHQQVL
jgi:hypothetical protein